LLAIFLFVCVFMTLLILIQKGRGGGLASAFGGAGGNTAFGSKTGDVLTWATSVVFGVFLLLAVVMNLVANRVNAKATGALAPIPAATPAAPTPATGTPTLTPDAAIPAGALPPVEAPPVQTPATPATNPG
jgi:preprotein translocase subunit SecG